MSTERTRLLAAMVAAQQSLTQAWAAAKGLGLDDVRLLLDSASTDNANAIDRAFPGVFDSPMECYKEPFPKEA